MEKTKRPRYDVTITTRLPSEVAQAIDKFVNRKRDDYPTYKPADYIRIAVVKKLKEDKLLDKDKQYL